MPPMARLPRLILPDHPHHVLLRGHNGQPVFMDDHDRQLMLQVLAEVSRQQGVLLHAYVLMDNHLHLLVTPGSEDGLGRMMQSLGRRYVAAFNARHGRRGTLWEGRFRAALLQPQPYLLACMRYIELNPVRAGLCLAAEDWPWSSAAHHLGRTRDRLLHEHALYWALGNTPFEREAAYRDWLAQGTAPAEAQLIIESVLRGRPLASADFLAPWLDSHPEVVVRRPRGRPRKPDAGG